MMNDIEEMTLWIKNSIELDCFIYYSANDKVLVE